MAFWFRSAVDHIMFHSGNSLEVLRVIALQALDELNAKPSGQKRILAVGFLPSPPSRIPEDIDVGGPESQSLVSFPGTVPCKFVMLGPCLIRNSCGNPEDQILIMWLPTLLPGDRQWPVRLSRHREDIHSTIHTPVSPACR